jgi:hypothetical protein
MSGKIGKAIVRGCRNCDITLLLSTFKHDDNVLLQHAIILEGRVTRLEQMHVEDCRTFQYEVAERAIVRSIAEASRYDRNELATIVEQRKRQGHESRVQIDSLNTDSTQCGTMYGIAPYLFVGGIQNGVGIFWKCFSKQASME